MAASGSYEYECTKKCKSTSHGDLITAVCTKIVVPETTIAAFLKKTCNNFPEVADKEGRTALHLVASTNRTELLLEWLLRCGANVNARDFESGQTPLHRALFHGCIKSAVLLLMNGASWEISDVENLSPLHYCLSSNHKRILNRRIDTETYAFGSNSHYNLGLDMDQGTAIPKCIEYFKRNNISVKSAALSSFHSLFLTTTQELFTVGHGVGGRLGHGQESTVVQPHKVNLRLKRTDEKIISFSASKTHSLLLTNLSYIYASGSNSKGQLGIKTNEANLFEFKNINCAELQDQNLLKVIALDNYSIAWSSHSIFAWGQNTGQLGSRSTTDNIISTPQKVLSGQQIVVLDACNSGIAFYTYNKLLCIFNNYKMKFFKPPGLEAIKQLTIGDADNVLKVLVMTESYQVYIWDDSSQKYTKCIYANYRQLDISKMFWCGSRIVFLVASGDVLMSTYINTVRFNEADDVTEYQEIYSTKKDICQTNRIKIGLKMIPFASNVRGVWCDYEGLNVIFARDNPYLHLKIPTIQDLDGPLDVLHDEVDEYDHIHDVVFHVQGQSFPAHKFVLLSRCSETFAPWIEESEDKKNCYLNEPGLTAVAFELILRIIYRNHVPTSEDIQRLSSSFSTNGELETLKKFTELMKRLSLGHFIVKNKKNLPRIQFERLNYQELYDVVIKCANDRQILAHKCVLVSRLKYFNMMFSSSWIETSEVNFTTFPAEYVEVVIDFLYDNSSSRLLSKKYSESFITNMIVLADQLFVDRLKDIFQIHVLKRFNMKRTNEWLKLAYTYNCDLLKKSILDFLCANLREVLENRILENCDTAYLTDLDERYREMFPEIKYRQVVPSSAVDEDYIRSFTADLIVDLTAPIETVINNKKSTPKASKESKISTKTKADYEKEGKLQLQEESTSKIEETPTKSDKTLATILNEDSVKVLNQIQEKNQSLWTKVSEKKPETKRKSLNANEILRNEAKMCENFSNLRLALKEKEATPERSASTSEQQSPNREDASNTTPTSQLNNSLSFGDFFSPPSSSGGRMSQKQRKRQSSRVSECEAGDGPSSNTTAWSIPETVWNIPSADPAVSTNDVQLGDMRRKKVPKEEQKQKNTSQEPRMINFDAILQDERKERDYFSKLKSKSLTLTQLEEAAITELLAFYNADSVFDEMIVVERKFRQQVSQNFSQWARPAAGTAEAGTSRLRTTSSTSYGQEYGAGASGVSLSDTGR